MKKVFLLFVLLILCSLSFTSCLFDYVDVTASSSKNGESAVVHPVANWTFVIYMAADNNLDSAAVKDFAEIEQGSFNGELVRTLVLLDRSRKNNSSKDEWSGTRLFEIGEENSSGAKTALRLYSSALGLNKGEENELDMGSKKTLSSLLEFSRKYYPAKHYGLIIWGHGTGYRMYSEKEEFCNSRAVAIDETSGTFMETCVLKEAVLNGMGSDKLEIIGFDTCFSAELEEVFELRNCAQTFVGIEGSQNVDGWNYSKWMNEKLSSCENGKEVARLIREQDQNVSIAELEKAEEIFNSFDSFSSKAASLIKTNVQASELSGLLLRKCNIFTVLGNEMNPVYIDVISLCECLSNELGKLDEEKSALQIALENSIESIETDDGALFPLGVYFCSLDSKSNVIDEISPFYTNGSKVKNQCEFVKFSKGYVHTISKTGSLLDKLSGNYNF